MDLKVCPWIVTCHLFADLVNGVNRHLAMRFDLLEDNPKKFPRSTPERQISAFARLWGPLLQEENPEHGFPSSARIIRDIGRAVEVVVGGVASLVGVGVVGDSFVVASFAGVNRLDL